MDEETETACFTILGRALAEELTENYELAAKLEPLLNARVKDAAARDLIGLEPLPHPQSD